MSVTYCEALLAAIVSATLSVGCLVFLMQHHKRRVSHVDSLLRTLVTPSEDLEFPRPEGASILRANGETVPVELIFDGVDEDGCRQWRVDTPVFEGDKFHVDVLPGMTGITYPMVHPE
jgi:hypothetical protein